MRLSSFYFVAIVLFTLSCNSSSDNNAQLYKCVCEEIPEMGDSTQVVEKLSYIFLVASTETPDCCSESVLTKYPGYKEVWENEAPNHPKVWRRPSDKLIKIDALEAQSLGCAMENKNRLVALVGMSNHSIKDYYPELVE